MLNEKQLEMLKEDPLTKAVDEANLILAKIGVKIDKITPIGTYSDFRRVDGKLYTKETVESLENMDEKYYRVRWTDTFDYDDYTSYETEISLKERIEKGRSNMQRFNSKVEITKEEYLAKKW